MGEMTSYITHKLHVAGLTLTAVSSTLEITDVYYSDVSITLQLEDMGPFIEALQCMQKKMEEAENA